MKHLWLSCFPLLTCSLVAQEHTIHEKPIPLSWLFGEAHTRKFSYDKRDSLLSESYNSGELAYRETHYRDSLGQLLRIEKIDLQTDRMISSTRFDKQGRIAEESLFTPTGKFVSTYEYQECPFPSRITFSGLGKGTKTINYNTDCQELDRTFISETDTIRRVYEYNTGGELKRTTVRQRSSIKTTDLRYDRSGQLVEQRDSVNGQFLQVQSYWHTKNGLLENETLFHNVEGTRTINYSYNRQKQIEKSTERFFYEPHDELVKTYEYDQVGNLIHYNERSSWRDWDLVIKTKGLQKSVVVRSTDQGSVTRTDAFLSYSATGKLLEFIYEP